MKKMLKNRLFEQRYNNVMKRLGTSVRRILESEVCNIDDDAYEIENISDLTLEDFYDPSMNASFANYKGNSSILCRGNKIGFSVRIFDEDENDVRVFSIFRDSFGEAREDLGAFFNASIIDFQREHFFEIKVDKVVREFFDAFRKVITDELADEIEERADDLYYKCFANAKSVDDVVMEIKKMENNF